MTLHTLDVCNSVYEGSILKTAIKDICIHNFGKLFQMPTTELVPRLQSGAQCVNQGYSEIGGRCRRRDTVKLDCCPPVYGFTPKESEAREGNTRIKHSVLTVAETGSRSHQTRAPTSVRSKLLTGTPRAWSWRRRQTEGATGAPGAPRGSLARPLRGPPPVTIGSFHGPPRAGRSRGEARAGRWRPHCDAERAGFRVSARPARRAAEPPRLPSP